MIDVRFLRSCIVICVRPRCCILSCFVLLFLWGNVLVDLPAAEAEFKSVVVAAKAAGDLKRKSDGSSPEPKKRGKSSVVRKG